MYYSDFIMFCAALKGGFFVSFYLHIPILYVIL